MTEWWPMLSDEECRIEWSPDTIDKEKNLRVKKTGDRNWILRKCKKAEHAIILGQTLLARRG